MKDKDIWVSEDEYKGIIKKPCGGSYYFSTNRDSFIVSKSEVEEIINALLDDLGKGWKKYIPGESEPEIEKTMRYRVTVQGRNGNIFEFHDTWADGKWTKYDGYVIAFQLPAPYQPEEK